MTGIMFNEDDSHFGLSRKDEKITKCGLDAILDNTRGRESTH